MKANLIMTKTAIRCIHPPSIKTIISRSIIQTQETNSFSHIDPDTNRPCMVDVSGKSDSIRTAHARCTIELPKIFMEKFDKNMTEIRSAKGPVITTAIIAGVMAAKKTSDLIPFCHPIPLENCDISIEYDALSHKSNPKLIVDCYVKTTNKTGVEMEALVGVTHAALCVYDMCKGVSHDIKIGDVMLMSKSGGKNIFNRDTA